jgi:hypothetical protein
VKALKILLNIQVVGALGVVVALIPRFTRKIEVQRVVFKDVEPPLGIDDCSTA